MESISKVFHSQRFKELREENKLSIEFIGEICSVNKYTVARWEASTAFPSLDNILLLSRRYRCCISYMLGTTLISAPLERYTCQMRLKEVRRIRSMTIKELSQLSKITCATICRCEKDPNYIPRLTTCKALCDALKISLDYLLGLCDFEKWEDSPYNPQHPFTEFQPGDAILIEFAEHSELGELFGFRINGLINRKKTGVILSDHAQVTVTHKDFETAKIIRLVPYTEEGNHEK